jgi:hypothetical protein
LRTFRSDFVSAYRAVPNRTAAKDIDEFGFSVLGAAYNLTERMLFDVAIADRNALRRERFLSLTLKLEFEPIPACFAELIPISV